MDNLKKATYIAVLLASVMVIFSISKSTTGHFGLNSNECETARVMAFTNLRLAYNSEDYTNEKIERAEGYSSYYNAFCKP